MNDEARASSGAAADAEPWHAWEVERVVEALRTDAARGLDAAAVEERRARSGYNRLTEIAGRTPWQRLLGQLDNLFLYLLLVSATVAGVLGEWVDAGVIVGVVVIIVVIGFSQEGRAERSLEAVRSMLSPKAQVVRAGQRRERPAGELVPGDLVLLEAGDRVPADLRLVEVNGFGAQESVLTGESTAVDKRTDPVAVEADLGDRRNMAYSGTVVTGGRATGVVVAIGDATEIGRISSMLAEVEELRTPLMRRLDQLTRQLSVAILALSVFTFLVGVLVWGRHWGDMLLAGVAVAVAAVPEGLPAVMTVTLAIGVRRMAAHQAIIRRLPAVETLGSVTIICSDKTGTLTRNEMTAKTVRTAETEVEVEGVGYAPEGRFLRNGEPIDLQAVPALAELVRAGLGCNELAVREEDGGWIPEGDPTEAALIVLARKAGLDPAVEAEAWPRVDVIPFASERRYMATLHHDAAGHAVVYVKGAPERVLEMCSHAVVDGEARPIDRDRWHGWVEDIAARGERLFAIAKKDVDRQEADLDEARVEDGLLLLGLVGLIDPPRAVAIESVAMCQRAGIRVKMITGDHASTASAIARQLGLERPDAVVTGRQLREMSDAELEEVVQVTDVFARASPEHKLRLVTALQARGAITAMTGDGVNDAPALKRADIGIAMGKKGTDAAREAAAMVLVDDDFRSIEQAVEQGRIVYDNLMKALAVVLPTSAAEALVIVIAILIGSVLPITPVQVLWINMVTASTLGMALAWERGEADVMDRPPRPEGQPLLTGFMLWRAAFVSALLLLATGAAFLGAQAVAPDDLAYARTMAINTLVVCQVFYLLNARFLKRPSWTLGGLFGNPAMLVAIAAALGLQVLYTHAPFMHLLFESTDLGLSDWAWCLAAGAMLFGVVEIEKTVFRWRERRG